MNEPLANPDRTTGIDRMARHRASMEAVRLACPDVLREPTPAEIDRQRAEQGVNRQHLSDVWERIKPILEETNTRLVSENYGESVALTDEDGNDRLDIYTGRF